MATVEFLVCVFSVSSVHSFYLLIQSSFLHYSWYKDSHPSGVVISSICRLRFNYSYLPSHLLRFSIILSHLPVLSSLILNSSTILIISFSSVLLCPLKFPSYIILSFDLAFLLPSPLAILLFLIPFSFLPLQPLSFPLLCPKPSLYLIITSSSCIGR